MFGTGVGVREGVDEEFEEGDELGVLGGYGVLDEDGEDGGNGDDG